ncbi:Hypp9233 [Branchiostoma lanceolatum]|uniref:Hypp9233 protein n=1 Tax=Branchiostoma lanceolatum TaxID=7740 RepID=A0A8K0EI16_BRALA|nr:Hypp9233 [Branchiostoma lanceolatum]
MISRSESVKSSFRRRRSLVTAADDQASPPVVKKPSLRRRPSLASLQELRRSVRVKLDDHKRRHKSLIEVGSDEEIPESPQEQNTSSTKPRFVRRPSLRSLKASLPYNLRQLRRQPSLVEAVDEKASPVVAPSAKVRRRPSFKMIRNQLVERGVGRELSGLKRKASSVVRAATNTLGALPNKFNMTNQKRQRLVETCDVSSPDTEVGYRYRMIQQEALSNRACYIKFDSPGKDLDLTFNRTISNVSTELSRADDPKAISLDDAVICNLMTKLNSKVSVKEN